MPTPRRRPKDQLVLARFAFNLRLLRESKLLGVRQLARLAGISYPMLRHIEREESLPSVTTYKALCKALNLPNPPLL